jgi:hypothetical protein
MYGASGGGGCLVAEFPLIVLLRGWVNKAKSKGQSLLLGASTLPRMGCSALL